MENPNGEFQVQVAAAEAQEVEVHETNMTSP